jgi:lysophospholipase L1-like esterase
MTIARTKVLLGDSTFDSFHWVSDESETVTEQLKAKLADGSHVINLAMDGFTTVDVLNGADKSKAVMDEKHLPGLFYPLQELAKMQNDPPSHIILSVGGNDLRESLTQLIYTKPDKRIEHLNELLRSIQVNYRLIIDKIKSICPQSNIVIMLQYTPSLSPDVYYIYYLMQQIVERRSIENKPSTYLDVIMYKLFGRTINTEDAAVKQLHTIMEQAYGSIIAYARQHRIPILDMSTTFDHTNKDLYVAQIAKVLVLLLK